MSEKEGSNEEETTEEKEETEIEGVSGKPSPREEGEKLSTKEEEEEEEEREIQTPPPLQPPPSPPTTKEQKRKKKKKKKKKKSERSRRRHHYHHLYRRRRKNKNSLERTSSVYTSNGGRYSAPSDAKRERKGKTEGKLPRRDSLTGWTRRRRSWIESWMWQRSRRGRWQKHT